jgi:hypothetical protein
MTVLDDYLVDPKLSLVDKTSGAFPSYSSTLPTQSAADLSRASRTPVATLPDSCWIFPRRAENGLNC